MESNSLDVYTSVVERFKPATQRALLKSPHCGCHFALVHKTWVGTILEEEFVEDPMPSVFVVSRHSVDLPDLAIAKSFVHAAA